MAAAARRHRAMPARSDLAAAANMDDAQHAVAIRIDRRGVRLGTTEADPARAATLRAPRRADTAVLSGRSDVPARRRVRRDRDAIRAGEQELEAYRAGLTNGNGRPVS